jgi:N-formylglutamate amidohydrolase
MPEQAINSAHKRPLVIHVPHASTLLPERYRAQFGVARETLDAEIHHSADLHTDSLARAAWPDAVLIEAEVSRVLLDVERYEDDAQEAMARVGRGVIYTHDRFVQPLKRNLSASDRQHLLDRFYRPHWQKLRETAKDAVLIDLHTYPTDAWPIEPDGNAARPEIDLGTSIGITPPDWISALRHHFEGLGFSVGENTPYAGVIDAGAACAVMIEIRRDILGNKHGTSGWQRLAKALARIPLPNNKQST